MIPSGCVAVAAVTAWVGQALAQPRPPRRRNGRRVAGRKHVKAKPATELGRVAKCEGEAKASRGRLLPFLSLPPKNQDARKTGM